MKVTITSFLYFFFKAISIYSVTVLETISENYDTQKIIAK